MQKISRKLVLFCSASFGLALGGRFAYRHLHCDSTDDDLGRNYPLLPGFKAMLVKKIVNNDFSELHRPEVLIEIGLLSLPVLIGGITSYGLILKNRKVWKKRHFYQIVSFSLNSLIKDPKTNQYSLSFRTLREVNASHILPNEEGTKMLIDAAKKTTPENPFLQFPNNDITWTMCNCMANQISSLCSETFLHRDINNNDNCVKCEEYVCAITCEEERIAKDRKVRVMLIKKKILEELVIELEDVEGNKQLIPKLERSVHHNRWDLIKKIAKIYKYQPRSNNKLKWGEPLFDLELCSPIYHHRSYNCDNNNDDNNNKKN